MTALSLNVAEAVATRLADLLQPETLAGLAEPTAPIQPPAPAYDPDFTEANIVDQADAIVAGETELLGIITQQQAQQEAQLADLVDQVRQLSAAGRPAQQEIIHRQIDVPPAVRRQAQEALAQGALFLDLETTGLSKKRDRIVEIAITDVAGHALCHFRLDPARPIPPQASAVHGITDADVAGLPTWEQVAPLVQHITAGKTVIGYMVGDDHRRAFDSKFIPREWGIRWVCAKELADQAFGKYHYLDARSDWRKSGRLLDRLRQCGLQPGPAHTALGDCLSTLRLMRFLAGYEQTI